MRLNLTVRLYAVSSAVKFSSRTVEPAPAVFRHLSGTRTAIAQAFWQHAWYLLFPLSGQQWLWLLLSGTPVTQRLPPLPPNRNVRA